MNNKTIKVWDLFVRIVHWSLVLAFVIAYLTAEEENPLHIYSGYAVLGLITFRVLWGFIGTKYARFSNFIYSPIKVTRYLGSIMGGNPEHYIGHNPAGGYMVIALLISLFVVTITGLKLYAVEEGKGPLAESSQPLMFIDKAYADEDKHEKHEDEDEFWEELHEISTNVALVLIFLHITGVLISSWVHKENLILAMITGRKKVKKDLLEGSQ